MATITFWDGATDQCGNTSSSLAFACLTAIEHNIRVLLISTSLNDTLINDSFWPRPKVKKIGGLFASNKNILDGSGIDGLDRVLRSNKLTPDIIQQYTKVVLTNRLEVLPGVEGTKEQYDSVKDKYLPIITMANKFYDMVIVDLDRKVGNEIENSILKNSDIVVTILPQRAEQITEVLNLIDKADFLNSEKTILAIGKYMANTKYNAKNISRSLLKRKQIINTIPYNNLFFEASQEGKVIDLFLNLLRMNNKNDENSFIQELRKLYDTIKEKEGTSDF